MLKKPVLVPYYTSIGIFSIYLLIVVVLTIHIEGQDNNWESRSYRNNFFAFATGLHGLLVLLLIIFLYIEVLYFVPSRVQGYAHFNRKITEWIQQQQYTYTAFSICVMILVILSQEIPRREGHQEKLDFFVLNNFFFLLITVSAEYAIIIYLIVRSIVFINKYVSRQPAADSLNYYEVLGIQQGQQVADAEIMKGQRDAINKMTEHLEQLNEEYQQLANQLNNCKTKETSPEFERIRLELFTAKNSYNDMRLRIKEMERELKMITGENEYLQGQIEGFRRSVKQGAACTTLV